MKKYTNFLVAFTFLFGLGVTANAAARPELAVTLPFQFMVGNKTLPAGRYAVSRLSDDPYSAVRFTNKDHAVSVLVLPVASDNVPANKATVAFDRVGGQYLLSSIHTLDYVYKLPLSNSVTTLESAKHGPVSISGSAGGK